MTSYYKQIQSLPMLEDTATASTEELIVSHLRLVTSIVSKTYRHDHELYDDLIQIGNIALMTAAKNYDATRGIKFASYAIPYIQMLIMNYVMDNRSDIKVLTTKPIRKAYFNQKKYRSIDGKLDRERMSADLSISVEDIQEMEQRMSNHFISIGLSDTDEDDFFQVPDENSDPAKVIQHLEFEDFMQNDIKEAMDKHLTDRERFIIEHRYFVDEPLILKDIAPIFGVSVERVRQIEKQALGKLKKVLDKKFELCKIDA